LSSACPLIFSRQRLPLLKELCRAIVLLRDLHQQLTQLKAKAPIADLYPDDFQTFNALLNQRLKLSSSIVSLSTRMRLTPQSRYDYRTASRLEQRTSKTRKTTPTTTGRSEAEPRPNLTDSQLQAVTDAARPLQPHLRSEFLQQLAAPSARPQDFLLTPPQSHFERLAPNAKLLDLGIDLGPRYASAFIEPFNRCRPSLHGIGAGSVSVPEPPQQFSLGFGYHHS
jgi:hypothetical protein